MGVWALVGWRVPVAGRLGVPFSVLCHCCMPVGGGLVIPFSVFCMPVGVEFFVAEFELVSQLVSEMHMCILKCTCVYLSVGFSSGV